MFSDRTGQGLRNAPQRLTASPAARRTPADACTREMTSLDDVQLVRLVAQRVNRFFTDEAMDRSRTTPPGSVIASAVNGCVTLQGTVIWRHERMAIGQIVSDVTGVRGLNNLVAVAPGQRHCSPESQSPLETMSLVCRAARCDPHALSAVASTQ